MAVGFEGSKGILYSYNQERKGDDIMALGIEGSKELLTEKASLTKPNENFQKATLMTANKKMSWTDFFSTIQNIPLNMSVSAFSNNQCSLGCRHCYLRKRNMQIKSLPTEKELSSVSNKLQAVDFAIVGMEPLETWNRTRNVLEMVQAPRKAIITNGINLTKDIAVYLAKNNILTDFSIGEKKNYPASLKAAKMLNENNVKATASCILVKNGVDPFQTINDISNLNLPMVFFTRCTLEGKSDSDSLLIKLIEDLQTKTLQTKVLIKVDFLSPNLLHVIWKKYFSNLEFSDLITDLDEGFLIRQLAPNLFLGAYPFPGDFINRVRMDADGILTTCYHMQLPVNERLKVSEDLRFQSDKWLAIPEIFKYYENYGKNYFKK